MPLNCSVLGSTDPKQCGPDLIAGQREALLPGPLMPRVRFHWMIWKYTTWRGRPWLIGYWLRRAAYRAVGKHYV